MTDDKLTAMLRQALQSDELPPEIQPAPVKKAGRINWLGVLAVCACLALCIGGYFALRPDFRQFTAATESAMITEDTSMKEASAAPAMGTEQRQDAVVESYSTTDGTMIVCSYPTALDAAVNKWMAENAPNIPYELLAESERYCSYTCAPAEGERRYLVIDKQTMQPVSLGEMLERGDFAVTEEDVEEFYVNQNQELILVQGTEGICLGPIE